MPNIRVSPFVPTYALICSFAALFGHPANRAVCAVAWFFSGFGCLLIGASSGRTLRLALVPSLFGGPALTSKLGLAPVPSTGLNQSLSGHTDENAEVTSGPFAMVAACLQSGSIDRCSIDIDLVRHLFSGHGQAVERCALARMDCFALQRAGNPFQSTPKRASPCLVVAVNPFESFPLSIFASELITNVRDPFRSAEPPRRRVCSLCIRRFRPPNAAKYPESRPTHPNNTLATWIIFINK
jgi:hypothetical protein